MEHNLLADNADDALSICQSILKGNFIPVDGITVKKQAQKVNIEMALETLTHYADAGHAGSIFEIADTYFSGKITKGPFPSVLVMPNFLLSEQYFLLLLKAEKVTDDQHGLALFRLAMLRKFANDLDGHEEYLTQSANGSHSTKANATHVLATYFYNTQRYDEAVQLLVPNSATHLYSKVLLSFCYQNGFGTSQDLEMAKKLQNEFIDSGN